MHGATHRPHKIRRLAAIAVAGATLGTVGALTAAEGQDEPAHAPTPCRPTARDYLRAADAARRLEAERPDLFGPGSGRADHDDLRQAAEWARHLAYLYPNQGC